jgi:hypothetical protein
VSISFCLYSHSHIHLCSLPIYWQTGTVCKSFVSCGEKIRLQIK